MIINKSGVAIRMGMDEMRVMGRNTQGVRLINLKKNDEIAAIAKVAMDKEVEDSEENEEIEGTVADNHENDTEAPQTDHNAEDSENSDSEE